MIKELLTSYLTYIALALIAASVIGLFPGRVPEKFRNGLFIPLLLGIALLIYAIVKSAEEPPEVEPVAGEFSVPAYQSKGIPYVNYMSFPISVEFFAEGQWSASGQYRALVGPEGSIEEDGADRRFRLPGAKVGALILQREAGSAYEYVGRRITLELQPKEKVLFLINDYKTDKAYSDNQGEMKIRWICSNCRGQNHTR